MIKILISILLCFGFLVSKTQTFKVNDMTYSIGDSIMLTNKTYKNACKEYIGDDGYESYCGVSYKAKDGKYYKVPIKYKDITIIINNISDGYVMGYCNQFPNVPFYIKEEQAIKESEIAFNRYPLNNYTKEFWDDDAFYWYCKLSQKPIKILAEESLKTQYDSYEFRKKYKAYNYENLSIFDKADAIENEIKKITEKINQVDLSKTYYFKTKIEKSSYDLESQSYTLNYNELRPLNLKIATSKYEYTNEINTNDLVINKVKFKIINQDFFFNDKLQVSFENAKYYDKRDFYSVIFFKVIDDSTDYDKDVIKIKITEIAFFDNDDCTTNLIGKIK